MRMIPPQYQPALALEQALGDPERAANVLSFRNAMALDEAEAFPEAAAGLLHTFGLHRCYVPRSLGGAFDSSETFVALGRVLARRDMSVAVSYSTMLWTVLAWIGGSKAQQRRVADWVLGAGEFPCLAYSESGHGADLAANELAAHPDGRGGYRFSGEKWPINRATRSGFMVLLARTDDGAHLRNHSLFIVNKRELDGSRYYHLPRVKTYGLRGCDISGIGFRNCPAPADALVGAEGHGLELALKGFQVTRTFCTALSLGVGDSALRVVTDFALARRLYGGRVADLPHTREVLANAYLSQLIGECASIAAARGLHLYPSHFPAWSSVAKVQVTQLVDHACQQLAGVLGARYYLRDTHYDGLFQKILRDGAVVSLFDGSSIVCLDSLATLLPGIARRQQRLAQARQEGHDQPCPAALYDLRKPLPALPFEQFDLSARGHDAVIESLPGLIARLRLELPGGAACGANAGANAGSNAGADSGPTCGSDSGSDSGSACGPDPGATSGLPSAATLAALHDAAATLQSDLDTLLREVLADPPRRGERNAPEQIRRAERFCALHAAVTCLGVWLFNRAHAGGFFAQGDWLLAALERRGQQYFRAGSLRPEHAGLLAGQLLHQFDTRQMFSLLPWPLAARDAAATHNNTDPDHLETQHDAIPA